VRNSRALLPQEADMFPGKKVGSYKTKLAYHLPIRRDTEARLYSARIYTNLNNMDSLFTNNDGYFVCTMKGLFGIKWIAFKLPVTYLRLLLFKINLVRPDFENYNKEKLMKKLDNLNN
jgi:hypothetical protein